MWRTAVLASVAALAGCDVLFGLRRVPAGDAGIPDMPIDAADGDGDGLDDIDDNCRIIANADQADRDNDNVGDACDLCVDRADDQHDEDADAVGDRCDNCPLLVNPNQANGDGDDLGDACDGVPTIQCIGRFDGFATMSNLVPVGGTWIVENDQLVQTDPETVQGLIVTTETFTRPRVETVATPTAFGAFGSHNIGVWGAATPGAQALPDGVAAEVYDPSGTALLAVTAATNGMTAMLAPYDPLVPARTMSAGANIFVVIDLRAPASWAARADVDASTLTRNGMYAPNVARQAGLRTVRTIARFEWLWIVVNSTTPCPPRP